MQKRLKAVIPVAGTGTRMLPATKAIPKEMLPVVDKPLIQYIVNECVAAGIKDIVLVTHSSKNAIENHFDTSFELEAVLESRVKRQLLEEVQTICPADVTVMQVRQGQAKGLGHAVLCAKPMIGDEPFIVLLPDVLLDDSTADLRKENLAKMIQRFADTGFSQIMVEPVPEQDVSKYGVVDCGGATLAAGASTPMTAVVEKPTKKKPLQSGSGRALCVVCGYLAFAGKTLPGAGDEIQLTDAIAALMEQETVEAFHMSGKSHDCGDKLGYMKAFVQYGLRHASEGEDFTQWLKQTLNSK